MARPKNVTLRGSTALAVGPRRPEPAVNSKKTCSACSGCRKQRTVAGPPGGGNGFGKPRGESFWEMTRALRSGHLPQGGWPTGWRGPFGQRPAECAEAGDDSNGAAGPVAVLP